MFCYFLAVSAYYLALHYAAASVGVLSLMGPVLVNTAGMSDLFPKSDL